MTSKIDDKKKFIQPLIKWNGSKYDELKYFIDIIPTDISTYLEPFAGSAAVMFNVSAEKYVISDVHKELVDFYNEIKNDNSHKIYEYMENNKNDEDTYYKVREFTPTNSLENASRFYYLRKTCFRGMMRYNSKGQFNIPFGRYKTCNFEILNEKFYHDKLKKCDILLKSFEYIFENYNDEKNFMFLDPPYDSTFTDYGYCKFDKEHHVALAKLFKETKIRCLLIIGETEFIRELYKDYIVSSYNKKYRFKIHSDRVNVESNHLIIKNY